MDKHVWMGHIVFCKYILVELYFCFLDCPYGDRNVNCTNMEAHECYYGDYDCCATCRQFERTGNTCVPWYENTVFILNIRTDRQTDRPEQIV